MGGRRDAAVRCSGRNFERISFNVGPTLLGWLAYGFSQGKIIWSTVGDKLFDHTVLTGVWHTVLISVCAMAMGLVLGVLFAVMRLSRNAAKTRPRVEASTGKTVPS